MDGDYTAGSFILPDEQIIVVSWKFRNRKDKEFVYVQVDTVTWKPTSEERILTPEIWTSAVLI
jgi:hypothetical protein